MEEVFDTLSDETTWGNIVKNQKDPRWAFELEKAIRTIIEQELKPEQLQGTFLSKKGAVIRPILYRVDKLSNGSVEFYLLLVTDVSADWEKIPSELSKCVSLLRMAMRFRYEVIDYYRNELRRLQSNEVESILTAIRDSIETIECESRSRMTVITDSSLRDLFDDKRAKEEITNMFDSWYTMRQRIFDTEMEFDRQTLSDLFESMLEMNKKFMQFTCQRYSKLVQEKMLAD